MSILFCRPPRYMWPMNSESSSFWQPLGFASMAAVLRENNFDVEILDCLPLKIGWKSLAKIIEKKQPDVLGLGDEVASAVEAFRLAKLTKQLSPHTKIVGGGYYFSYMAEDALKHRGFDFIIRGEGELTMLELAQAMQKKKPNYSNIKGMSYLRDGVLSINPERPLIKDLDSLPFPAYDLLPMHMYGNESINHPSFTAIEHGRGCINACSFCSIWKLMSSDNKACYRTKSAQRSFEETEMLVKKYHRKTLNWTDGTYNADPKWSNDYSNLLLNNNLEVMQTTWMRSDFIVRDERAGILKKMVDAGLVQTVVGVERINNSDLSTINKRSSFEISQQAFKILRKYKKVFSIASLIYGMPEDDRAALKKIERLFHSTFADTFFLLPYTPYPGTMLWEKHKGFIGEPDLSNFNLHLPVMGTNHLTRKQLNSWFKGALIRLILWPDLAFKRIFFEPDARKRRIQISLTKKIVVLAGAKFYNSLTFQKNHADNEYGLKPDWYES